MPLQLGAALGPYQVTAKIGEGGMGEVYQARDTKLDRDVALKVLPEAFTSDPDRLARFEREAKVLASLNHPNIGSIYGLEEAPSTRAPSTDGDAERSQGSGQAIKALVLELVEGPTLADRIKQGPIPIDEALPIAKQIAEALEAAHERGVIHRDLKPANIKVKDDGTVKVLDFGLAKAFQPDASDPSLSQSPTISLTAAATQMGMVIGTAAYMSPEQAKGKTVDKRADVWAFGTVLFEILTGRKMFGAGDVSDTLAYVLTKEIDWTTLPGETPAAVRRLLRRCLERDPKRRLRYIGDAWHELEEDSQVAPPGEPADARGAAGPQLQVWQRLIPAVIVALAIAAITGLAVWGLVRPAPAPPGTVTRFPFILPDGDVIDFGDGIALSADALDKAHRQGITHRDLKPGNIMLTKVGAKLLDFGLAKLKASHNAPVGVSAPTVSAGLTGEGAILGTLQYMAPEQLEGKEADARTDIFAFGALVYEMVTGQKAFEHQSQASLIHAIIGVDPPLMSTLQMMTPTRLDEIVKTCLAKDPDDRWQSAGDVGRQLDWIAEGGLPAAAATHETAPHRRQLRLAWRLIALLAAGVAALAVALVLPPSESASTTTTTVRFPVEADTSGIPSMALSPNGEYLACVSGSFGDPGELHVRSLGALEATPLPGTEGARLPFWSPDSRFIGFFVGEIGDRPVLKTVELVGGPPRDVCDLPESTQPYLGGATWNHDDVILFSGGYGPLFRVAAAGGSPMPVLDDPALNYRWPQFLPDGRHFLFLNLGIQRSAAAPGAGRLDITQDAGIYVGSLDLTETTRVLATDYQARYSEPGYLFFVRNGALMAQPFDVDALALTGEPTPVAEQITVDNGVHRRSAVFSGADGDVVYRRGQDRSRLLWLDRDGTELDFAGSAEDYIAHELSPDGTQVAVEILGEAGPADI